MKRTISLLLTLCLLLVLVPMALAATNAVLSPQGLTVDGRAVNCEKYNIDGSNYFKLRDIAQLLNGTESQFAVGWDAASSTVSIVTGQAYAPNGSELIVGGDKASTAVPSNQTIMIDGVVRSDLSVYNIGGNNFFKLRDLGDALGFIVGYDSSTNTAVVKSGTRLQKNGFDSSTNTLYYFSQYSAEIPSYWDRGQMIDNGIQVYAETDGKTAMLQIEALYDTDEDYPVTYDGLVLDLDNMLVAVESAVFSEVTNYEIIDTGYVKGVLFTGRSANYQGSGLDISGEWFVCASEADRFWCNLILVQTDNTEYLYDDDFMKIVYSIRHIDDGAAGSRETVTPEDTTRIQEEPRPTETEPSTNEGSSNYRGEQLPYFISRIKPDVDTKIYAVNLNTKKFHYMSCSSVGDIIDENLAYCLITNRQLLIDEGYSPCGRCKP